MPFDASVRAYLRAYQNEYRAALHGGQHTAELSFRVPMHEMFRRIAHDLNPAGTFDIILEPRNQGRMGRPDWRIQDRISLGVYGYIEAKGPSNEPFDTTPYRDQINRYLTLGHIICIAAGEQHLFILQKLCAKSFLFFYTTPGCVFIHLVNEHTSKKQCLLSAAPIFLEQGKKFYHCPAEKNAIPSAEREIDILYHAVQFIDYRCRRK